MYTEMFLTGGQLNVVSAARKNNGESANLD